MGINCLIDILLKLKTQLYREHDENVDNSRDSGGYDSIDDLFDYYLSTIMIEESPVNSKPSTPTDKSYPVILSPRDTNDLDDSDILSSYPVILSPRSY